MRPNLSTDCESGRGRSILKEEEEDNFSTTATTLCDMSPFVKRWATPTLQLVLLLSNAISENTLHKVKVP
jgi:hypothetical protein